MLLQNRLIRIGYPESSSFLFVFDISYPSFVQRTRISKVLCSQIGKFDSGDRGDAYDQTWRDGHGTLTMITLVVLFCHVFNRDIFMFSV